MKRALNSGLSGAVHGDTPSANIVRVHHETATLEHFIYLEESCYCTKLDCLC